MTECPHLARRGERPATLPAWCGNFRGARGCVVVKRVTRGLLGPVENLGFPPPLPEATESQRALADAQAGYIEILEAANKSSHAAVMLAAGKLAKQKDGQKRGGKATAQGKAPGVAQWRQEAINVAKGLIANGRAQHEVAAIVAKRLGKTARAVRPVLQDAGIVRKRERC